MSEAGFVPLVDSVPESPDFFQIWDGAPHQANAGPIDEYARGLAEGQQLAETAFAEERKRLLALIAAADALQPVEPETVRDLIFETVDRLVREIVGTAPVDPDLFRKQIDEAVHLAGPLGEAAILRLSPDDAKLLERADIRVRIVPDARLSRGTLRLETDIGAIEHGRAVQLEALNLHLGIGGDGQ